MVVVPTRDLTLVFGAMHVRGDAHYGLMDVAVAETAVSLACVTSTRNQLACMPVDRGKSWEPAHTFLISPHFVLSRYDLISSLVFTVVSLIKGCCPLCTSSASRLVSCLAIIVCSRTFCYYSYLLPSLVT